MNFKEFSANIRKARNKKDFKIKNSFCMKNIWRWLKKNKWLDLGQSITELQMGTIVKRINAYYQSRLLGGYRVTFPYHMGDIQLIKYDVKPYYKNGKLVIPYAIDWLKTMQLWYENEESRNNKELIRQENKTIYRPYYSKRRAIYNNKVFMEFDFSRAVKKKINEIVKQGLMPF